MCQLAAPHRVLKAPHDLQASMSTPPLGTSAPSAAALAGAGAGAAAAAVLAFLAGSALVAFAAAAAPEALRFAGAIPSNKGASQKVKRPRGCCLIVLAPALAYFIGGGLGLGFRV